MKQLLDFIIGSCVDNRTKFQLLAVCYGVVAQIRELSRSLVI